MPTILGKRAEPTDALHAPKLPKIRNRYRFLYMAHPHRWLFDEADYDAGHDGWLPSLGRLNVSPGVGGVRDGNQMDLALVQRAQAGWQVIPGEDPRLGDYRHYTQRFPAEGRNPVWGSIFDSVKVLGGKVLWKHDDDAYRAFRRHLIEAMVVPAMDPDVRDQFVDQERATIEQMEGRLAVNPNNPALAQRIKERKRRLSKMDGTHRRPPAKAKGKAA